MHHTACKHEGKNSKFGKIEAELGLNGIFLFKTIFSNNNVKKRKAFFMNYVIQALWEKIIRENITEEICFGTIKENLDLHHTFCVVTETMMEAYNLDMPRWWIQRFPPPSL